MIARALVAAVLAALLSGGCESGADDSSRTTPTPNDSAVTLKHDLPSGRFELPTGHTPAPNLWITLPAGYGVRSGNATDEDVFFLVASDDSSGTDSSRVTPGFLRIYVGSRPQRPFTDVAAMNGPKALVAGRPMQWRLAQEALPGGGIYMKREIVSGDIFGALSPELARLGLILHVYVAGADSGRVSQLMRAAESLSIVP